MRGFEWACSSAGEHYVDIVGVTGSIPVTPTIRSFDLVVFLRSSRDQPTTIRKIATLKISARGSSHCVMESDQLIVAGRAFWQFCQRMRQRTEYRDLVPKCL
jgi:hypothetical protein